MKCKLNDLCFIIKPGHTGNTANLGKVVTCTEYLGYLGIGRHYHNHKKLGMILFFVHAQNHYWGIEGNLINYYGVKMPFLAAPESELLPIKG
jgi:hypothetical protein